MPRKVILDVDPGIGDAVALCLALFDPRLEVLAVTAVGGNVPPALASRNVQAVVEQLDPPRWPRLGVASEADSGVRADTRHLFGPDGLGNANFEVAELHNRHPSEKVLADEIRSAPDEVTVIAMGPLTNIARVFRREPDLAAILGQLVIFGGTVSVSGDATPAAEFNMFCDPVSAHEVLRAPVTKTLIPLDVTQQVVLSYDLLDQVPDDTTRAGRFLQQILPHAFRSYRERLGLEGVYLNEAVALAAVTHPELFQTEEMAGDVETGGDLCCGATVFDRRLNPQWRVNTDVAVSTEPDAVIDYILRGLSAAAQQG